MSLDARLGLSNIIRRISVHLMPKRTVPSAAARWHANVGRPVLKAVRRKVAVVRFRTGANLFEREPNHRSR